MSPCLLAAALLVALAAQTSAARVPALGGDKAVLQSAGTAAVADDPAPRFYSRFAIDFNETNVILFKRKTQGRWYYDAASGNEVVVREDGRGDRYCGSIHPLTNTPCTHLVTSGNRYLLFPDLGECCLCCNSDEGCGILSPHWLRNATYQGTIDMNGVQSYKFYIKGLQPNYWFATADAHQIPVELDQWPNDYQTFHPASFSTGPIPQELLQVPASCHSHCPISSTCSLIKGAAAAGMAA